jgi:hypothetical protein
MSIEDAAHKLDLWLNSHINYYYMVGIDFPKNTLLIHTTFNHIADLNYLLFNTPSFLEYPVIAVRYDPKNVYDYDCVTTAKALDSKL